MDDGDEDNGADETNNQVENAMNDLLASYNQDLPALRSLMHHQFQSYQYLNEIAPRSFSNTLGRPFRTSVLSGSMWVNELLQGHPQRFYENFRMDKPIFRLLCNKILETGGFVEHQRTRVHVEESLGIFLQTVGMHHRHRISAERFQHSPETISRHVHIICDALCALAPTYITPPNFDDVPTFIANNPTLYPFFKDCIGAIDGTIIEAWVPSSSQGPYRCRKGHLAQNVMVACDFNLQFTFVLAGWEGSANDARIMAHALNESRFNFPWPPQGKYYVVDSGYTNFPGFLAPYRGERYHIPEWTGGNREPNNVREMFNRRHATVRNIVERCFGLIKKRFPMLKGLMPNYLLDTQAIIVLACCVIHNFVKRHASHDELFKQVSNPDYVDPNPEFNVPRREMDMSDEALGQQFALRDSIAQALWNHRQGTQ